MLDYTDRAAILAKIAKENRLCDTLETRRADSLDFHDVAVWNIKEALEQAWAAGYQQCQKDKK